MNWTKASALAEIVSSIAILATLVYLAIQTQQISAQTEQNTAAIVSSSRQLSLGTELELFRMLLDHPEANVFARIFPTAGVDFNLGELVVATATFRIREHEWLQHQAGLLDTATWETSMQIFISQMQGNAILRQIWDYAASEGLNPDFSDAVNSQLPE